MTRRSILIWLGVGALFTVGPTGCYQNDNDDDPDADAGDAIVDTRLDTAGDTGSDTGSTDADAAARDADVDSATTDGGTDADTTRDTEPGDVVPADTSSDADAGPMCMEDKECPGNAVCEEGSCRFYRFVQIRDITRDRSSSADTACSDDSAGADLFQLELRGPFGTVLGYASGVAGQLKADANTDVSNVFDGVANSLQKNADGHLCPSGGFGPGSVVSLGCGGSLVVAFADGAGDALSLSTGQRLIVDEYGNQCCDGGCPEEYWEIRVCSARAPQEFMNGEVDDKGNHPTCNTAVVGTGTGRGEVTLQLPRN